MSDDKPQNHDRPETMSDSEPESADLGAAEEGSGDGRTMNYGKEKVAVYRTYATPLEGVETIPESSFDGRENVLLGLDVRVQVEGEEFLPSFSEGDNSVVVATDSMKNFVLHQAGEYDGATLEGFLHFVGSAFLDTYDQMSAVQVSADEIAFDERPVPTDDGFEPSDLVFGVSDDESAFGEISLARGDDGAVIDGATSGVTDLELAKVKGSSFADYVQDEYTTLPEREDRALFVALDIFWTYDDAVASVGGGPDGVRAGRAGPGHRGGRLRRGRLELDPGSDLSDRAPDPRTVPAARVRQLRGQQPHLDRGADRPRR